MAGPIPTIPNSILRQLSSQVSQSTLSRATLEAAARQMGVGLGEFMNALHAAQGEIGRQLSAGPTRQAAASFARQVYSAVQGLEGAGELAALQTAAAETAAAAGEVATTATTVASGGRLLGFFGRIGSAIGLTGAAATAAGIAATVATLGIIVAGGAQIAGSMSGDDPVEYGSAVNDPRGEPPAGPTIAPVAEDRYAVFLLTNVAGGSIWIGTESSLQQAYTCHFAGGGLCASQGGADILVLYSQASAGDFATTDEAHVEFCSAISSEPRNYILAHGVKATIYGGDYWIDLVGPC